MPHAARHRIHPRIQRRTLITDAIESVLTQTSTDFELLIIDDGSMDATPEILARYAGMDARTRVVMQARNLGRPDTGNHGLDMAQESDVHTPLFNLAAD